MYLIEATSANNTKYYYYCGNHNDIRVNFNSVDIILGNFCQAFT